MLTRRDLIHSRQFLQQRMSAALVMHKADPLDWSGRRMSGAAFVSVMVVVVAFAVTGIYALISPGGNTHWQTCDAPIIEKETGAAFICFTSDQTLRPMANFASARLFTAGDKPVYLISSASLTWPRVGLLGIEGAPNSLPQSSNLDRGAWSVCSRQTPDGHPSTTILAGLIPPAGQDLGAATVLVSDPGKQLYLIWQGMRFPISDESVVLKALLADRGKATAVGYAWLDTLPLGPHISKLPVPDAGTPAWNNLRVGQVVQNGRQKYVVWDKTQARGITDLQAALLIAAYGYGGQMVTSMSSADMIGHIGQQNIENVLPPQLPEVRPVSMGVCAIVTDDSDNRIILNGVPIPAVEPRDQAADVPLADAVIVAPGKGILAESVPSAGASTGMTVLITDLGIAHQIPSAESLKRLGYDGVLRIRLPSQVIARVPFGPSLDHTLAGTRLAPG